MASTRLGSRHRDRRSRAQHQRESNRCDVRNTARAISPAGRAAPARGGRIPNDCRSRARRALRTRALPRTARNATTVAQRKCGEPAGYCRVAATHRTRRRARLAHRASGALAKCRPANAERFCICAGPKLLGAHDRPRAPSRPGAGAGLRAATKRRGRNGAGNCVGGIIA